MGGHLDQHARPRGLGLGSPGLRPGPSGALALKRQSCTEKSRRLKPGF